MYGRCVLIERDWVIGRDFVKNRKDVNESQRLTTTALLAIAEMPVGESELIGVINKLTVSPFRGISLL
jgi:hypothetical protein